MSEEIEKIILKSDEIENFKDSAREKLENKTVKIYLENEGNPYFNEKNLKSYLITINFDTTTSYKRAWKDVQDIRNNVSKMLCEDEVNEFVISTIEHTHEIPKKHKSSELHKSKKLEDITKEYNKEKKKNLVDINESEYTTNLLNIYSEMRYTGNIYEIDEKLKDYLDEKIDELTKKVDAGEKYNFEYSIVDKKRYYKMSLELYMSHMQTELHPTTIGYPHIHIGLWRESSPEVDKTKNLIYNIVKKYSGLNDIDIASSKYQGNPLGALEYVCKNHSSKIVNNSLKRVKKDETIISATINSLRYYEKIKEVLYHISNKEGKNELTSNKKSSYNKSIAMEICVTKKVNDKHILKIITSPKKIKSHEVKLIDAESSKRNAYINYIQKFMKKKELVICDGLIYKKIEGSKSSYNYKYNIDDFLDSMERVTKYMTVSDKIRKLIEKNMKLSKVIDEIYDEDIIDFPRVKLNYRMIEFRDFYYCLVTRAIYKEQYEYHTYLYCPEICLEELNEKIIDLLERSTWIKQLKASGIYTINDISILNSIVHNRKYTKCGSVLLIGEADTGKSTIIKPFLETFPGYKVGRLQTISEHHIYDQVKDKEVVAMNEANGILRNSSKTANRADSLLIFEGGTTIANKKLGEIISIDTSKTSIIMTGNIEAQDETFLKNDPLMKRIRVITTKQDTVFNEIYTDKSAKTECPLILIFSSMCSVSTMCNLNYVQEPIIYNNLEGENLEFIKEYHEFDSDIGQPLRKETDDIFRYSTMKEKGLSIPLTKEFEYENMPCSRSTSNNRRIEYLKTIAKEKREIAISERKNFYDENEVQYSANIY